MSKAAGAQIISVMIEGKDSVSEREVTDDDVDRRLSKHCPPGLIMRKEGMRKPLTNGKNNGIILRWRLSSELEL
ncbi:MULTISPECIES: hypothetical protein [Sphingomonas]|uniref:Uncharacterized protein n=1 Tax=Sphingomonas molluscorum TaxID=418184 RepID=A0ABU8Q272_9SPHN|nr:hypothetical protein [Sphingomonas sp. JUb134]MBM7405090.1 hypothetical protein [Sphingomonas sp. JUb134]